MRQLLDIIGKLYRGYGILREEDKQCYGLELADSQEDYEELIKCELMSHGTM
jgi:hypothetical protein